MTEKTLLQAFINYEYNRNRAKELHEKILAKGYKITPSYGYSRGSGNNSSKVERYVGERAENLAHLNEYLKQIEAVETVMAYSGLNEREKALLEWIIVGGKLSTYARKNGIYTSTVYKIRNRALRKGIRYIQRGMTQNE